uniref:C-CAP/cofactor C-like domain-containing protein n=1 Tax=Octactis speculum TaxID=3111310 RepID=A0A7S2DP14_9STRA|mmetsp:Transcript_52030/g.71018  ORF Transcript_52030/g.71018 Transcript_52030/m.71018 type:complete len:449 (+) Transcript_52030:82-1428(+)|eukprot:CAMPEP_0185746838 /NCGR_PEP_ID=MMETSP1174-20130828/5500_1 /TAXON_ID=35687 /ORGANISM="Dictyocha speculum, Strain CCMP1381" /LENGTH=448 /DNA_ID=CAMNT_0028421761 /DNA_START=73 /DNA_END=1419 /DNA_ORIENTATION=+
MTTDQENNLTESTKEQRHTDSNDGLQRDQLPRKDYYNKWDTFTKETVEELDEENERLEKENDEILGKSKYPSSEAEQKDKETNEKLKDAKKVWDKRANLEEAAKFLVEEATDANQVIDETVLQGKKIITFKNCTNCTYDVSRELVGMIKIFVAGCVNCTISVAPKLITSHVELVHCEAVTLNVVENEIHTVQVDLSTGVVLRYGEGLFQPGQKIYHAGSSDMSIICDGGRLSAHADYLADMPDPPLTEAAPEEQTFITQMVESELLTEPALHVGNRFVPQRELDMETATQAEVTEREKEELAGQAEREKLCGNQSFGAHEYSQAAVHYTMAIDYASHMEKEARDAMLCAAYSNRAACFLKLGQHDKALIDADQCIKANPAFVKGHFRRGLALHALHRYDEALPSLGKALELEKKTNKASIRQINEAIKFAEVKFGKLMQARRAGEKGR